MSSYLEEAAKLLRKASKAYEDELEGEELGEARIRIAAEYAKLAAIDKGLLPAEMLTEVIAYMGRQTRL